MSDQAFEVDPNLFSNWRHAREAAKDWKKEEERLRQEIEAAANGAASITVDGVPVISHETTATFQGAAFKKAFPELYRAFTTQQTVDRFDPELLRHHDANLYDAFRARQFRIVE